MSLNRSLDDHSEDDRDATDRTAPHGGADQDLSRRQRGGGFYPGGPGRRVRVRASNAGPAALRGEERRPPRRRPSPPAEVQARTAPSWRWFTRFTNSAVDAAPDALHNCAARAIASTVSTDGAGRGARKSGTPADGRIGCAAESVRTPPAAASARRSHTPGRPPDRAAARGRPTTAPGPGSSSAGGVPGSHGPTPVRSPSTARPFSQPAAR